MSEEREDGEGYYERLAKDLDKEKDRMSKYRGSKKKFGYITNGAVRRSTYSKRCQSVILSLKEIEVQTHCKVNLHIRPTWENGKMWTYTSSTPPTPVTDAQPSTSAAEPIMEAVSSPKQRHRTVPVTATSSERPAAQGDENVCRVCGVGEETSFWIGCGYRNKITKRQSCNYWVHQECIHLKFKSKDKLSKVPFFCPQHIKG